VNEIVFGIVSTRLGIGDAVHNHGMVVSFG